MHSIDEGECVGEVSNSYWIELATLENTVFDLVPTSRMVPTTSTRITANITAYSAMSCPSSSFHSLRITLVIFASHPWLCRLTCLHSEFHTTPQFEPSDLDLAQRRTGLAQRRTADLCS